MTTTTGTPMPSIYIPHGGGPAFFMTGPMRDMFEPMADYLATISESLPERPASILVVTAHWEAPAATVSGGDAHRLLYDYGGFPPEMYELTYDAPADPALATRVTDLLATAGIAHRTDTERGWDHGVFVPLKVMFPEADIPVVALSLRADLDPAAHVAIGRALAPLRDEGVLIVGSGSSYHNLSNFADAIEVSQRFDTWLDEALGGDQQHRAAFLADWSNAPSARAAHPREEHLMPLMVVSGAGSDQPARKVWQGGIGGTRISAWEFD